MAKPSNCDVYVNGVLVSVYKYAGTKNGKLIYTKAGKKMNGKTVNWTKIISSVGRSFVESFAKGKTSGRALYDLALSYGGSAEVRNLLRSRGVDEARQLARKALSRR
jgi:hypothetical protein